MLDNIITASDITRRRRWISTSVFIIPARREVAFQDSFGDRLRALYLSRKLGKFDELEWKRLRVVFFFFYSHRRQFERIFVTFSLRSFPLWYFIAFLISNFIPPLSNCGETREGRMNLPSIPSKLDVKRNNYSILIRVRNWLSIRQLILFKKGHI